MTSINANLNDLGRYEISGALLDRVEFLIDECDKLMLEYPGSHIHAELGGEYVEGEKDGEQPLTFTAIGPVRLITKLIIADAKQHH